MAKRILRKTKLTKKDINQHKKDLRKIGIIGLLDQVRHLKRFQEQFDDKNKIELIKNGKVVGYLKIVHGGIWYRTDGIWHKVRMSFDFDEIRLTKEQ